MKKHLLLIYLLAHLLTFSCKEKTNGQNTLENKTQIEQSQSLEKTKDSVAKKNKQEFPKQHEYKYVIARSGLNYRELPSGKVLGKFPLNTYLKIVDSTNVTDQIKDGNKIIKGKWLGVEKNSDTVYVFDGFLSNIPIQSDIQLYYASSYYKLNEKPKTAFINLSDSYFGNYYEKNGNRRKDLILTESDLKKDTIRLNKDQRTEFLNRLKLSQSEKIFVYIIKSDSIISLDIKNLPAIACMNTYGPSKDYQNEEEDYEFGFDLGKKITDTYNLVYIGKENPFLTGELISIVWKKIDTNDFPKKFSDFILDDLRKRWLDSSEAGQSYMFSYRNFDYYIQNLTKDGKTKHRYIVVIDSETKNIVHEKIQIDSESTELIPLKTESNSKENYSQWTGKLLKDKSAVMFGFLGYHFDCPSITILDETEPDIPIFCDNRH